METQGEGLKIGFVGLGDQGGAMADMLLADGAQLHVWARRESVAAGFAAKGAHSHPTLAALGAAVDLMCVCVTGNQDVLEVVLQGGLLAAMRAGGILAIHSTIDPAICEQLAREAAPRGVQVIDAPVSGSSIGARERRLLLMTGGDAAAAATVREALGGFCKPALHMGGLGAAMRAKFINNSLMAANLGLVKEALEMGLHYGIDRAVLREAMMAGVGRSFALESITRLEQPPRARHIAPMMKKDLGLAEEAARASGISMGRIGELAWVGQGYLQGKAGEAGEAG